MTTENVVQDGEHVQLPALIDRARTRLAEARTSAEVLEAKAIYELAYHHAKVTKAFNETHADCLRGIVRCEMRMADEIDRGQASGEVARAGGGRNFKVRDPDLETATFDDLGLDRRRVAEWREVRDAGEDVVEGAIQTALSEGRAPTKNDIRSHVRGTFGTGENEWYTPDEYLNAARGVLGQIDLDPASSEIAQQSVQALRFFTKETNGLDKPWNGAIWLAPPYARTLISDFVRKMVRERGEGRVAAGIMLTHNYTDTSWFHEAAGVADAICFTRGRVKFYNQEGIVAAPTQGQAFFYFGENVNEFAAKFRPFGLIVRPHDGEVD